MYPKVILSFYTSSKQYKNDLIMPHTCQHLVFEHLVAKMCHHPKKHFEILNIITLEYDFI